MLDKCTPTKKREAFIAELGQKGTVFHASAAAGIGRSTAYLWRERYPEFARAWDDAIEDCADVLEQSMYQRAIDGDTVAGIFMLKGLRPAKYRENLRHEVTGAGGADLVIRYVNDWRRPEEGS